MFCSLSLTTPFPQHSRGCRSRQTVRVYGSTIAIRATRKSQKLKKAEQDLLTALEGVKGRGQRGVNEEKSIEIQDIIQTLEDDKGIKAPTRSQYINGKWRLLFTSKPGTESPIQRTFTGVDSFSIFQEIDLLDEENPTVTNVVNFGEKVGQLRVAALSSTDSRPLPDFVPRQGEGLPLFGKSLTYPPEAPDTRIDFQFDKAAFYFKFLPFSIPYPVPFRLLGDETKGWLDTTYLSPDGFLRVSRGNKGTLFVLQREVTLQDKIVQAVASFDNVAIVELVEELVSKGSQVDAKDDICSQGKWRQIWSQQSDSANPLQRAFSNQVNNFQLVEGKIGRGKVQNLVQILPFLSLRLDADCKYVSESRLELTLNFIQFEVFGIEIPFKRRQEGQEPSESGIGFLDILYLDNDIRVSRGNRGSLFVHVREEYYDGSQ